MEQFEGVGSVRTEPAPRRTIKCYKLMRLVDGKLYPLYIDNSAAVELGVWYNADSPDFEFLKTLPAGYHLIEGKNTLIKSQSHAPTKPDEVREATAKGQRWIKIVITQLPQRRYKGESRAYYNVGISQSTKKIKSRGVVVGLKVEDVVNEGYAMRAGWHAGSLPTMRQVFCKKNGEKRNRDNYVFVEGEISADIDYNAEAQRNPEKDLPDKMPVNGWYLKATNADKDAAQADRVGWYVAGAIKLNRIISDSEAHAIIDRFNAQHPDDDPVLYQWPRESGKMFNADTMSLEGLHGTKKTATALTVTVIKSSAFKTLSETFKRRSTTTKPRLASYPINGLSATANLKHYIDVAKLKALIADFKIDNAEDFIKAIGKCFPQQVEKERFAEEYNKTHSDKIVLSKSKYQLVDFPEFGVTILLRVSDHNVDCSKIKEDIEEAYSLAFKERKSKNDFKPTNVTATEYVYFLENCDRDKYKRIAQNFLRLLETSKWDEDYVKADKTNFSPEWRNNPAPLQGLQGETAVFEKIFSDKTLLTNFLLEARGTDRRPDRHRLGRTFVNGMNRNWSIEISAVVAGDWVMSRQSEQFHGKYDRNVQRPSIRFFVTEHPKSSGWSFDSDYIFSVDNLLAAEPTLAIITKKELIELLANNSIAVELANKILSPDYTRLEIDAANLAHKEHNIGEFISYWPQNTDYGHLTGVITDWNIHQGAYAITFANGVVYAVRFDNEVSIFGTKDEEIAKIKKQNWYPQLEEKAKRSHTREKSWSNGIGRVGDFIQIQSWLDKRGGLIVSCDEQQNKYHYKDITGKLDTIPRERNEVTVLHTGEYEWKMYDEAFSNADWYRNFKEAQSINPDKAKRLRLAKAKAKAAIAILELMNI